ncbi:MAG: glycerophosphodiester phosphodiesterase family protein [Hyphomonadaceae bacterium]
MRRALLAAAMLLAACNAPAGGGPALTGAPPSLVPQSLPAFFDCLRESNAVLVSAHRGGPQRGYAENAIPTFEHTLLRAPAFLEVDVAATSDGELVLMHDETVDRTTDGEGEVDQLTLDEFQALRLRDETGAVLDVAPPTLSEALDWARTRAVLELDVKRGVSYEDVLQAVRRARALDRVIFVTYSPIGAARIARLAPAAMIYVTIDNVRDLDTLERRGADLSRLVAWLGADGVNTALLEALNARGVEVRVGDFTRNPNYIGLARAGVEGVAVDDPAVAYRAFDAADNAEGYAALQCASAE